MAAAPSDAAPLVQKLAAFTAEGPARSPLGPLCVSVGGFGAGLSARALTSYDEAAQSTKPDLSLNATAAPAASDGAEDGQSGGEAEAVRLLSARFNASNAGALTRASANWSALPPGAALQFESRGRGEASVAAALTFVPAEILPFPSYRGLWVQRAVLLPDPSANGTADGGQGGRAVGAAPLASTLTITVQVGGLCAVRLRSIGFCLGGGRWSAGCFCEGSFGGRC